MWEGLYAPTSNVGETASGHKAPPTGPSKLGPYEFSLSLDIQFAQASTGFAAGADLTRFTQPTTRLFVRSSHT